MAGEIIRIVLTEDDVLGLIEDAGPDADPDPLTALARARDWAKHIEATATQLCNEQLESVVFTGQP